MKIGIDAGYTGAICVIDSDTFSFFDMPLMSNKTGKNILNIKALSDYLRQYQDIADCVILEQVGAMPKQGVSSTFRFGECYGAIQGVVVALGFPIHYVTPQRWKKPLGLLGSVKDASRTLAIQQFPYLSVNLSRKKDIGRADAFWIAKSLQFLVPLSEGRVSAII